MILSKNISWRVRTIALLLTPYWAVQAQTSALPSAFKDITSSSDNSGGNPAINTMSYAARPDYSQPLLSPQGTHLTMVARQNDSTTTLVVLDISGAQVKPITRLSVPDMQSVKSYGWASEDKLVVWLNMSTKNSSDDDPSSSLYVAQLDLLTKKVTQRVQPTKMAADISTPYPLSSDLVRAPWKVPNHVLISECKRQGGVQYKQRGEAANYTFASTSSLPSSTIVCQLLDWDLLKNRASALPKPFYAYPTRFFANGDGTSVFAEGRKVSGKVVHATITTEHKKWLSVTNQNQAELQEIWDSSELDYSDDWKKIHQVLGNRIDPAGEVIKANVTGLPLGIQFTSPETRYVPLDAGMGLAVLTLNNTFAGLESYRGASIQWLGTSNDKSVVLFSVENSGNPGTYFVWRQNDNTIMRITNTRSLPDGLLGKTYLEPGWLPDYVPVAVTEARNSRKPRGYVLMPLVINDEAAAEQLHRVNMTAEWFAANGLVAVRIPVGQPASLSDSQVGDVWRKQVAQRLAAVARQLQAELKLDNEDACIYGRDLDAYAALAGAAFGAPVSCVIALNAKLDPKLFAQPFMTISSTAKTWYLSSNNVELRNWRSVYGKDLTTGTPAHWQFPASSNLMLGFDMFDEHRTLASAAADLQQSVRKAGGTSTLYTPNLDASKTDQWLSNLYDAMIKFILPPNLKKVGNVYVGEIDEATDTGK